MDRLPPGGSVPSGAGRTMPAALYRCCPEMNLRIVPDGGCGQGCCDDYRCLACGKTVRYEWPD